MILGKLNKILKKNLKNEFIRNVSLLVGGTFIAQLIAIGSSPVLSRLYSPDDFGIFATFMAILGIVSTLSLLKYELAIVVEKNNKYANHLEVLNYLILIIFTVLFTIGLSLVPVNVFEKLNLSIGNYIYLLTPLLIFTGVFAIQNNVLNREKKYKLLSLAKVINKIGIVVFQIIFGFTTFHFLGLIFGNLLGLIIVVIFIIIKRNNFFKIFNNIKLIDLWSVANKHYRFPKYTAPQTLLNTLSNQAPIYILGYFYGLNVVGAYWMAMRIIQLPGLLIGTSVRQVYYQKASEIALNKKEAIKLFNKTTLSLIKLIIIPVLVIFIFSKQLFILILGNDWELAGKFARWMILWIGIGFATTPSVMSLFIYNKQKINLIYDFLLLTGRILVLLVGGFYFDVMETIIIFSILGIIFNLTLLLYVKYKVMYNI